MGINIIYVNYKKNGFIMQLYIPKNSYFNLYLNRGSLDIFLRLNPKGNYSYIETSEIESIQTYLFKFKMFQN